jgi:hypothetical protein
MTELASRIWFRMMRPFVKVHPLLSEICASDRAILKHLFFMVFSIAW